MLREITSHKVSAAPAPRNLKEVMADKDIGIRSIDAPGSGGAHHRYEIANFDTETNPSSVVEGYKTSFSILHVLFQNGPIAKSGANGITNEALLAIVEDRLKCFQSGAYSCRENAIALTHVQDALHWLHHRTRERMARGVEGTHAK